MDELLRSITLAPEPWSAGQILLNTGVAFLLGLFIAWVYRSTQLQLVVSYSFINTLVLLSMIMAIVMMVIGNNIARAFGLAGAMSIIRFRTVVKDTRDTAFVFFALGAGMACGTGNLKIALIGTPLIGLFIAILHWTRHGAVSWSESLLTFERVAGDGEEERRAYLPILERYAKSHRLLGVRSLRMGEFLSLSFLVELKDREQAQELVRDLSALEGIQRVTISSGEEGEV